MTEEPQASEPLSAQAIQALFDASPFSAFLGLQVLQVDAQRQSLTVRMPLRDEIRRRGDEQFHGGAIATLIDLTGDFVVGMKLGGGVPTVSLHVDFLRPGKGAYLDATAFVRRAGRTLATVDIEVTDGAGAIVALGRGLYVPRTG